MIKVFIGLYVAFILALLAGWGMNLYKVVGLDWKAPYKAEVIRTAGVLVAPIGAVAGYVNIED